MTLDIKRIIPTENWELIGEWFNEKYRILEAKDIYDKGFKFLAFPNQLKAFKSDNDKIIWKNGAHLSLEDFYGASKEIELGKIKNKILRVKYKNQAPTRQHKTHHVYGVFLHPFDYEKPISLSESIGGGIADMGYSKQTSFEELKQENDWKDFLKLSDCEWIIPIIESTNQIDNLVDKIVKGICDRSEFNK